MRAMDWSRVSRACLQGGWVRFERTFVAVLLGLTATASPGQTPTAYRDGDHRALATVPGCVAKQVTRPSRVSSRIKEAQGAQAR